MNRETSERSGRKASRRVWPAPTRLAGVIRFLVAAGFVLSALPRQADAEPDASKCVIKPEDAVRDPRMIAVPKPPAPGKVVSLLGATHCGVFGVWADDRGGTRRLVVAEGSGPLTFVKDPATDAHVTGVMDGAVSADGETVVFSTKTEVYVLDRKASGRGLQRLHPKDAGAKAPVGRPSLSADSRWIAWGVQTGSAVVWWLYDRQTDTRTRLTSSKDLTPRDEGHDLEVGLRGDGQVAVVAAGDQLWYVDRSADEAPRAIPRTEGARRPRMDRSGQLLFFESDRRLSSQDRGDATDTWVRDLAPTFRQVYREADYTGNTRVLDALFRSSNPTKPNEKVHASRLVSIDMERGFVVFETRAALATYWPATSCSCRDKKGKPRRYPCGAKDPEMCGLGQCVLKSAEELKTSPCGQGPCGICSHSRRSAATRKLYIAWFQRSGGNVGFRLFTNTTHSRGINDGECYDAAIEPGGRQIYTLCSTSTLHPDSPKDGAPRIYLIDNGHI